MISPRKTTFIAGLAVASLMGAGCNPMQSVQDKVAQKVADSAISNAVSQASGGKVNVDSSKGQMVFKDNKTGDTMAFGDNVKLPDNFPKDVPVYGGATIVGVTVSNDTERGTSLTLKTTDASDKVVAWYEDQMKSNGFAEDQSMTAGTTEIRAFSKGNVKIELTVASDGDQSSGSLVTEIRTESTSSTQ